MSTLVLAHGFNIRDNGEKTIDKLLPYLSDHTVLQADYGFFDLFGVRFYNDNIARVVAGMTPQGAIGIGHSNGCDILVRACKQGAKFSRLILINPALDKETHFGAWETLRRIDVLHNMDDTTVTRSRFIPFSPWGEMGRYGYKGHDSRVLNHETKRLFNASGHSDIFNHAAALAAYLQSEQILINMDYKKVT